jgi:hypothetical protein
MMIMDSRHISDPSEGTPEPESIGARKEKLGLVDSRGRTDLVETKKIVLANLTAAIAAESKNNSGLDEPAISEIDLDETTPADCKPQPRQLL